MRILSLFDGISCGRVALERAEITVGAYYASENTQRYKAIGNGWTVDVIAHIFRELKKAEQRRGIKTAPFD
ncbi:MAG: hypothetical protein V8R89_05805 [Alphaproteobacteria bacterium]|jgi:hypothetical protein